MGGKTTHNFYVHILSPGMGMGMGAGTGWPGAAMTWDIWIEVNL
jgi:hypothetical protein